MFDATHLQNVQPRTSRTVLLRKSDLENRQCARNEGNSETGCQRPTEQLRLKMCSLYILFLPSGALAQLVRAPPCHGGGCGFEPRRLRSLSAISLPPLLEIKPVCARLGASVFPQVQHNEEYVLGVLQDGGLLTRKQIDSARSRLNGEPGVLDVLINDGALSEARNTFRAQLVRHARKR